MMIQLQLATAVPPVRPKAGQVFLFKPDSPANGGKLNVLAKVKAFGSLQ